MNTSAPLRTEIESASERAQNPVRIPPHEAELIGLLMRVTQMLGLPKSLGEIYGYLFVAEQPQHLDAIQDVLGLSRGSTSQGLRALREMRAIRSVHVLGDRRDHFVAETHLRALVGGILIDRIEPALQEIEVRLESLTQGRLFSEKGGSHTHFQRRLQTFVVWHKKASRLIPWARKFLKSRE